jgi:hypothetical protein
MIGVIAHPELATNDRRHPLGGPDIPTEAERFGAALQQVGQPAPLLVGQFGGRAGGHAAPQGLNTALPTTPHPLADCSRGHPQRVSNRLLRPALLLQVPRPQPTPFTPLAPCSHFCNHTDGHRTARATFSNRHGDQ